MRIVFDSKPMPFPRVNSEIEISVFRVIQEALTNIHRHSGSTDARIEIHQQPDRIVVRVRDFGVGIPDETMTGELQVITGVGISGMKERLKQMGGEVRILRAEPGTLVEAIVPLFS